MTQIPTFGKPVPGARSREGSYALIFDPAGRLLVVLGRRGLFLPGGGVDPGETPEQALARELQEECALAIGRQEWLGEALQHFVVDGEPIRMVARFWRITPASGPGPAEDVWEWREPQECRGRFFHACADWALEKALG